LTACGFAKIFNSVMRKISQPEIFGKLCVHAATGAYDVSDARAGKLPKLIFSRVWNSFFDFFPMIVNIFTG
jgi:hypothetical protein